MSRRKPPKFPGQACVLALAGALLLAVARPAGAASADPPSERTWPLPVEPAVSSSFCEYREGHLHAGLDIRTFGREGVPCRSAGDGYVSRIRTSARGYGKAVYVALASGETLVYAHLAEFAPELEKAVYKKQMESGGYSVDFRFGPDEFPVRRGDIIAYTGSTGAEAPHLHFEIRDAGENPLNPFSHGFDLDDRLPPEIRRIIVLPLDRDATVNGRCMPVVLTAAKTSSNRFAVSETLRVSGEVGLAAEIIDGLNPSSGRLAPYRVELSVDGSVVSETRLERFSFAHTSHVDLLYDIAQVRLQKDYFIQLFERDGDSLWNRSFVRGGRLKPPGAEDVAMGEEAPAHAATVKAADRSGNESELTLYFLGPERKVIAGQELAAPPSEIPGFYFFEDFVSIRDDVVAKREGHTGFLGRDGGAVSSGNANGGDFVAGVDWLHAEPVTVPYHAGGVTNYLHLSGVKKGEPKTINVPSLGLHLVFGEKTLFTDMIVYAAGWNGTVPAIEESELTPRASLARIGPYSATFRNDLEIRFLARGPDSTCAVYRLNEQRMKWVFYESSVDDGVVSTAAKRPGVYTVFSDGRAPRIQAPIVGTRESYATGRRRPEIVVAIEDGGSGVDDRRTAIYLTGHRQIARWDDISKKMFVLIRDENIIGPQALTVAAYDMVGNRSQLDATIEIPGVEQRGNE